MKKVLIITGPAGDAQGWGDLEVTRQLCDTLNTADKTAEIVFVENKQIFLDAIETRSYDIIWSALYHVSTRADIVGLNEDNGLWIADTLDSKDIPYIGPDALTMKQLIQKNLTHEILKQNQVSVPYFYTVDIGDNVPDSLYPVIVKPSCESRSVGISDDSVAPSRRLDARAIYHLDARDPRSNEIVAKADCAVDSRARVKSLVRLPDDAPEAAERSL